MLITFKTRARYPNITMFGDVAFKILELMGRRDTLPSAMEAEDIPAALNRLREGLQSQEAPAEESGATGDGEETKVSLDARAGPLIEMLDAAAKEGVGVMWEES